MAYFHVGTATTRVVADLEAGQNYAKKYDIATGALLSTDSVVNVEGLYGSSNNDGLYGTSGANTLWGIGGNDVLEGRAGADTLYGGDGNDGLTGGTGNDYLYGDAGSDTYNFTKGDGQDVIVNRDASTSTIDAVKFIGPDARTSNVWLARSGNDLVVSLLSTTDKMTFQNWYTDTANQVDQFVAGDGKVLASASVQQLVNAMAAFSPSTSPTGVGVLPTTIPTSVQTAISSTWTST